MLTQDYTLSSSKRMKEVNTQGNFLRNTARNTGFREDTPKQMKLTRMVLRNAQIAQSLKDAKPY
ncbi:hypothetical protein HYPSUDRAFT_50089, partial [Hypholoma sublateritium FD-334 SS-4]